MQLIYFTALVIGISLFGCSSSEIRVPGSISSEAPAPVQEKELAKTDLEALADQVLSSNSAPTSVGPQPLDSTVENTPEAEAEAEGIPVEINERVKWWVEYFTLKDRERFARFLKRGAAYKGVVQTILSQNGVPPELYYLAMIESGYQTHAHSRASAVGVWQFIRATGKRYGLEHSYYVDERRDPIRATEAAAKYLRDLYLVFDSWYLALAAYNAGEARIMGAIMRGNSRDFWELARKRKLPRETMNYVPKFLAALIIGENLDRFGFTDVENEKFPDVDAVAVPTAVSLKRIAQIGGIDYELLKRMNPHIRRGVTPPGESSYELWIPEENAVHVKGLFARFAKHRLPGVKKHGRIARNRHYHRVRRGENLTLIAKQYQTTSHYLRRLNRLSGSRIYPGQRLRVTARGYHHSEQLASKRYRVRRGDTLLVIARRFGLSVQRLKRLNGLRHNRIYAGQSLRVAGGSGT